VFAVNEGAAAVHALGRQHFVVGVRAALDFEATFAKGSPSARPMHSLSPPTRYFSSNRPQLIELAAEHRIPTSYSEMARSSYA
jgi:hypothetical protein